MLLEKKEKRAMISMELGITLALVVVVALIVLGLFTDNFRELTASGNFARMWNNNIVKSDFAKFNGKNYKDAQAYIQVMGEQGLDNIRKQSNNALLEILPKLPSNSNDVDTAAYLALVINQVVTPAGTSWDVCAKMTTESKLKCDALKLKTEYKAEVKAEGTLAVTYKDGTTTAYKMTNGSDTYKAFTNSVDATVKKYMHDNIALNKGNWKSENEYGDDDDDDCSGAGCDDDDNPQGSGSQGGSSGLKTFPLFSGSKGYAQGTTGSNFGDKKKTTKFVNSVNRLLNELDQTIEINEAEIKLIKTGDATFAPPTVSNPVSNPKSEVSEKTILVREVRLNEVEETTQIVREAIQNVRKWTDKRDKRRADAWLAVANWLLFVEGKDEDGKVVPVTIQRALKGRVAENLAVSYIRRFEKYKYVKKDTINKTPLVTQLDNYNDTYYKGAEVRKIQYVDATQLSNNIK